MYDFKTDVDMMGSEWATFIGAPAGINSNGIPDADIPLERPAT